MKTYFIALGRLFVPIANENESLLIVGSFFAIFIIGFLIALFG